MARQKPNHTYRSWLTLIVLIEENSSVPLFFAVQDSKDATKCYVTDKTYRINNDSFVEQC